MVFYPREISMLCLCLMNSIDFQAHPNNRLSYQDRKDQFHSTQHAAHQQKLLEHRDFRNSELRKFRQKQLQKRQNLETVLITEVSCHSSRMSVCF